ncbi:hypothetical protein PVAG01_01726 [Phlyctema vagabunda]|uniref:BTB domain-containing protein n=1 Tax=Phlyctema vagabunda TaxID=108571 RepID=A0ABR4PXW2_9HELO
MVSQPESSHSLALRGPSSVVSHGRSSRHRRHGRSHAGGSAFIPQNEFPVFSHTGDVEIIVKVASTTNRYLLHRLILTQCSGFFEASTSQEWSRATVEPAAGAELARIGEDSGSEAGRRKEGKRRWRYELDSGTSSHDIPMLVQKDHSSASLFGNNDTQPPPVRNKPPSSNASFFRSVANLSLTQQTREAAPLSAEDQDLIRDYDNLFRIFYNYAPSLDPIDIANAYIQCKSLLTLADLYDALSVVGPRIDHHLLQFQSRLWKQIAKYPSSYLRLGYLSQSKTIFQEALIHVVGAWPMGERHIRRDLPESVLEIIEDKVEDLEETVGRIEGKLFRLTLTTPRGERVTPQNSYLDWLVVSFFRQWLAESTSPPPLPPPPRASLGQRHGSLGGNQHSRHNTNTSQNTPLPASQTPPAATNPNIGRVYRILGSSPPSFLLHDDCKRFLKLSPDVYSRESLKKFERRLEELRAAAREIVRPLMRCSLLGEGGNVPYLVCTKIDERDFPWREESHS